MKADPPNGCEEIGPITGKPPIVSGNVLEDCKTDARNQAAEQGANYLRWETIGNTVNPNVVTGTAYKCPDDGPEAQPAIKTPPEGDSGE